MNNSQCILTGANFLDVTGKRWIHGDLHQLGDIMIFNASGCEWVPCEEILFPEEEKGLYSEFFYEKNYQIVFPLATTCFNEAAHKFLTAGMDAESIGLPRIFTFDSKMSH